MHVNAVFVLVYISTVLYKGTGEESTSMDKMVTLYRGDYCISECLVWCP